VLGSDGAPMDGAASRVLGLGRPGYASPPERSIGRGGYCGWGNGQPCLR